LPDARALIIHGRMTIPTLETDRLRLRPPCEDDFAVYRAFYADADASHFYGGPLDEGRAWRVLASDLGHWALRGYGRWAIELKASGVMVGSCGLWWPGGWPRSELTWWIIPSARRQGYAAEASRAAIGFGYRTLGWPLVETHADDANEAVHRLVAKLGGEVIAREAFPDGVSRNVYGLPASSPLALPGRAK
jgi:RimJ/RimL family protein N-acetyltransferase